MNAPSRNVRRRLERRAEAIVIAGWAQAAWLPLTPLSMGGAA